MNAKELRELDDKDLAQKLSESRRELFNLKFQHATAQLENNQKLPAVRRTIARILTIQRKRKVGA